MPKGAVVNDPCKLVIVGDGAVGKSALTMRFMYAEFVADYEPTKVDSYKRTVQVPGDTAESEIQILDTAGQEDFAAIRDNYIRSGEGFLCVFSVTDPTSFNEIKDTRDQILRVHDTTSMPIVLVGNKIDLEENRLVSHDEAVALAQTWGIPYLETSAKTDVKVNDAFFTLVHEVRAHKLASGGAADGNKSDEQPCCALL